METYTEFQNRRKILLNLIGDGIAIISNSDESSRNRDCNYLFRSDSYFHYLSGFPEPEAVSLTNILLNLLLPHYLFHYKI